VHAFRVLKSEVGKRQHIPFARRFNRHPGRLPLS
jgi:hypothetical protein